MNTIADALAIAIEHPEASRLAQAEQLYRQILQQQPNRSIQALHRPAGSVENS
jgi:hypothetical protein